MAGSSLARQRYQPQAIKIECLGALPGPGSFARAPSKQALSLMMNNKHTTSSTPAKRTLGYSTILVAESCPPLRMQRIPLGLLTNTILVLWQILQMTINRPKKEHNGKCIILSRLRKFQHKLFLDLNKELITWPLRRGCWIWIIK